MLPPDKRMVLNMEHAVPATTIRPSSLSTLSGFVYYTAVVGSQRVAGKSVPDSSQPPSSLLSPAAYLTTPHLHILKTLMPSSFVVIEAKLFNPSDHVPQAVCDMYARGKLLQ